MKKNAVRIIALGAAAAVAMSLAGCFSGSSDGDGTTLTVYGWKGSEAAPAGVPEINAAFEKANPGVTVNYEFLDAGDSINQRLQPELLAGNGPDVFMASNSEVANYVANGNVADLSDESWVAGISDAAKPFVTIDDAVYATPLELIPIGLYANMDVLGKAGITEFPTTIDEFTADLKALDAAGLPGLAIPNKGAYTSEAIINGIASTLVYRDNPEWDADFMAGDANFADWSGSVEQFLDLDQYTDLKEVLGIDEWGQGLQDFKAGNTAFLYQGGWNLTDFQASVPSVQFGPWPASSDGDNWATVFSGVNWVVNDASSNQDLAKKYVEFWADNLDGFLEAEAAFSPFTDAESPTNDAAALVNDAVAAGKYRLLSTNTWMVQSNEDTMGQDVQGLVLGQTDVDGLLTKWDAFRE